jgi:hypothetical protein
MGEDGRAIALDMLVEPDAGAGVGQHTRKCGLADLRGSRLHVVAVQLDQVEREGDRGGDRAATRRGQLLGPRPRESTGVRPQRLADRPLCWISCSHCPPDGRELGHAINLAATGE